MPYTRAELLQAVKTDHPEFKDVPDNKLFAAIAVDHPDLARGISELNQPEYKSPEYLGGPTSRTAAQVAQDQAANALRGNVGGLNIPGAVVGLVKTAFSGPMPQLEAMKQMAQPAVPVAKTVVGRPPSPESPEWAQAAQGAGALLTSTELGNVGPAIIGKTGEAVRGATTGMREAIESRLMPAAKPAEAIVRGIKPTATNLRFKADVEKTLPVVKQAESTLGKPIETVQDLDAALDVAKAQNRAQWRQLMGPQADRGISGAPIADAIEKSISFKTKLESPAKAKQIQELADSYRRNFSVEQLDGLLQDTNAELQSYYGKYPAAKAAAAKANPDIAQTVAQADALRDTLYGALDSESGGTAARQLQREYGSLANWQKEVKRRINVNERQQPQSLNEQISRVRAAGQAIKGGVKILSGKMALSGLADLSEAIAGREVASAIKEANSTNGLISRVFKHYSIEPTPIEMPPPFQPAGLLGEGAREMPAAPDTSFVRGVPAQPAISGTPRLLTAGATPMPAVPDTSYVRGVPAELAKRMKQMPASAEKVGSELPLYDRPTVQAMNARMAQFADMVRSGATEMTGKAIREEGGGIVGRHGGGMKLMFKEFRNFTESPGEIASAIEKGRGPLYDRVKKAVLDAVQETGQLQRETTFAFGANAQGGRVPALEHIRRLLAGR